MGQQKLSVIIPTHNRVGLLPRALASIHAQTSPPAEVIVVDDGSTDGTERLMQSEFPGVWYLRQENRGVAAARNHGIREARGEWLAFLDSDDEWLPQKLERQLDALAKNPELLVLSHQRNLDPTRSTRQPDEKTRQAWRPHLLQVLATLRHFPFVRRAPPERPDENRVVRRISTCL